MVGVGGFGPGVGSGLTGKVKLRVSPTGCILLPTVRAEIRQCLGVTSVRIHCRRQGLGDGWEAATRTPVSLAIVKAELIADFNGLREIEFNTSLCHIHGEVEIAVLRMIEEPTEV